MTSPACRWARVVLAVTGTVVLALLVAFIFGGRGLEAHAAAAVDLTSFVLIASRPRWWDASEGWRDEWCGQFVLMEPIKMGYYFAFAEAARRLSAAPSARPSGRTPR